jgi:hypothetical protein
MAEGLELIDQRPAGNTYAILFDSMYAANIAEGNWTARTNLDAASRTVALLEEMRRCNDVRLIHVKGHSAHQYLGNDIADELAWWGSGGKSEKAPPRSAGCDREEEKGRAGTGRRQTTRRARGGARRRRRRLYERPLLVEMLRTSGRCDGRHCRCGGRGCWRSHPRNGRCG